MKRIKTLIAIMVISFAFLAFSNIALAQTPATTQSTTFQKGRLFTTDGRKIKFYSFIMDQNVSKYQVSRGDIFQEIATNRIGQIDKETGNGAVLYGVTCGLAGLAGGYLAVANANNDLGSLGSVSSNTKAITIISTTAVCALVGVLIGSGQKKYSTVYDNKKATTGLFSNFNLNIVFNNNLRGLSIKYAF